jgi:hypothetical protein
MEAKDVVRFKNIYSKQRKIIMDRICTYENLVIADVTLNNLVSWIEKDIDTIRANVPLTETGMPLPNSEIRPVIEFSEAALKRIFLNKSIEERHLLRICQGLLSTIKSKMYRESK